MASLYLFDDERARGWSPFRLTRPAGELLYGCLLLRQRHERAWGSPCAGYLGASGLEGYGEPGAPPVVDPDAVADAEARIVVSSRFVPAFGAASGVDGPATLVSDGRVAGWVLPPGEDLPDEAARSDPDGAPGTGPEAELEGEWLEHPWSLVAGNARRVALDVPVLFPHSHAFLPAGVESLGTREISTGEHVTLEPGVVLDAREGPIRLEDGVRIRAHTRLAGPAWIGADTEVLGGTLGQVSIGPVCRVRGEVEASVILGFTNKAHDGFLGHAYVGRWVNLGALTTNSDLKNNYGTVRVGGPEGDVDTGLRKVGCFLGDHVKTAIGTLLNTGTVVGAGTNLFGAGMPPRYVPPFSWGGAGSLDEHRLDAVLETAERVMARRDRELGDPMRDLLRRAWEGTRALRRTS